MISIDCLDLRNGQLTLLYVAEYTLSDMMA